LGLDNRYFRGITYKLLCKAWPDTTKDAGILLGYISIKLISGEFEITLEDEKIKAIVQNPLLKYGIRFKELLNK